MKTKYKLILNAVFIIILLGLFFYLTSNTKYQEFPKGCFQKYPENMTPSGFVSADKEYCYAKIHIGRDSECSLPFSRGKCNSYKHISWERVE